MLPPVDFENLVRFTVYLDQILCYVLVKSKNLDCSCTLYMGY